MDKNKLLYQKLKDRMGEVSSLPGHPLGKFTPYYRGAAPYFKTAPYKLGIVFAVMATIFIVFLLGPSIVKLASILSRGF